MATDVSDVISFPGEQRLPAEGISGRQPNLHRPHPIPVPTAG